MARFRFRLEPVLDHRERIESEKQRVFATKLRDLVEAEAERDRTIVQRDEQREILRRDHRSLDVETLRATYVHLAYLDRAILSHQERVDACRAEADRAHAALIGAAKDRKVLETLKVHRREAHDAQAALVEQRELDDANARAYGRAKLQQGMSA
jgi:flagellar export protein FliJ